MGLGERKAVQAIKDSDYKNFEAKVQSIAGTAVKLTFDWAALENNPKCVQLVESKKHNSYMFDRVTEALTKVCADDMGKSAVKESLKEIKMVPSVGNLTFQNGVLTIYNDLEGNGAYDAGRIKETLEKGL